MTNTRLFSNKIFINWNPLTNNGQVVFHVNPFIIDENESPTSYTDPSQQQVINKQIEKLCEEVVSASESDPVTGASLENISGAGIMLLIKRLTDTVIAELEPQPDE